MYRVRGTEICLGLMILSGSQMQKASCEVAYFSVWKDCSASCVGISDLCHRWIEEIGGAAMQMALNTLFSITRKHVPDLHMLHLRSMRDEKRRIPKDAP